MLKTIKKLQGIFDIPLKEDTSIYDLYDNSIQMVQILSKINKAFDMELGMVDFVTCESVGELAEKIQKNDSKNVEVIGEVPLSFIQQSYWLGREQEFFGGKNTTHLYLEVRHTILPSKIEELIRNLIKRHETLRSFIKEEKQVILGGEIAESFCIETIEIKEEERNTYFEQLREASQTVQRDLEVWPLFDVKNVCVGKEENILVIDIEMIIVDGMSLVLMLNELQQEYKGQIVESPACNYMECIKKIQSKREEKKYNEDKKFWIQKEAVMPEGPKLPETGKSTGQNLYKRLKKQINEADWKELKCIAKNYGVTASIVLLYIYFKTLERFSEKKEFTVNVTLAGRPYGVEGIDRVLGDFTSNVLMDFRGNTQEDTTKTVLQKLRNKLYEYYDHASYEGVEVIRDMIKSGKVEQDRAFPIVFTSMLFGELLKPQEVEILYCQSQTSQVSLDNQIYKTAQGALIVWDYLEKIYPEGMIEDMFQYYTNMVDQFIRTKELKEENADFEERIYAYNETEKCFGEISLIQGMIETFHTKSEKIAITDGKGSITYTELEKAIAATMQNLKNQFGALNEYVLVKTDKSKEAVITILSVVFSGAAYIPVDRHWPEERVRYIMENVNSNVIVDPYDITVLKSDADIIEEKERGTDETAYIIYTSGSTGRPKGVAISYAGMLNTIMDINQKIQLDSNSTVLGLSSFCFDLSVYDIFASMLTGAQLMLVQELRDTANVRKLMTEAKNIVWNSVPAAVELFVESLSDDYVNEEVKYILMSGDWINVSLPERIKRHFPKAEVYSLGGATEASIWSIYYKIENVNPNWSSIPYGYPLSNQTIYVLNSKLQICPPDVLGEIYIGGMGVAKYYMNDSEKTEASFIETQQYGRIYKTGDYGKFSREGYVIFCGRKDSQVKIGGYRIELGEIENQISSIDGIDDCVAVVSEQKQIAAFYKGSLTDIATIKRGIRNSLPTYMYPYKYFKLEAFPLNANGKIDRKALEAQANILNLKMKKESDNTKNSLLLEEIMAIWAEVLEVEITAPDCDFFELGGDSIKAQRIIRKIEQKYNIRLPYLMVIQSENIQDFAKKIEEADIKNVQKAEKFLELQVENGKEEMELPMTGVQIAYLNGQNDKYELGKYSAHYYFELDTKYTAKEIEQALRYEIQRHDALRAIFLKNGVQQVLKSVPDYEIQVTVCKEEEKEQVLLEKRKSLSHKIYEHDKWPLFTFEMIETDQTRYLLVSLDLLVCDGDSMQVFLNELADILSKKREIRPIQYSYRQYIQDKEMVKNPETYQADKAYWLSKLDEFSKYPHIPMVQEFSKCKNYVIERKRAVIDKETWASVKKCAKEHKTSPSAVLCTIYGWVLSKWSRQKDMTLNLTVFERLPFHDDVEQVIGDFTKLLPLELHIEKNDFWKSVNYVQSRILEDLDHLSFDGTEVMRELAKKRRAIGKALLPVVFTCVLLGQTENYFERLGKLKYGISQTPQVCLDNQITELSGELHISWDIVKELFEEEVINKLFEDFIENIQHVGQTGRICEDRFQKEQIKSSINDFVPQENVQESAEKEEINSKIETEFGKKVMEIWAHAFGQEQIDGNEDFYSLGGDSIILMQIMDEMNKLSGVNIEIDDILQSETIYDFVSQLSK